ncbi:hypothetical protein XI01_03140 [Bradyrhizobium sp. CCBAU 21360]|nr:hypothetical protein [Bradyrhizobium sp. CCBAU 21360]
MAIAISFLPSIQGAQREDKATPLQSWQIKRRRSERSMLEREPQSLVLAEAYDRLGFYAYHVAEHHCAAWKGPSPSLFLSSVAQRTRHLRLGPLVMLFNFYHPLRAFEEICMLDQLSGGGRKAQ